MAVLRSEDPGKVVCAYWKLREEFGRVHRGRDGDNNSGDNRG